MKARANGGRDEMLGTQPVDGNFGATSHHTQGSCRFEDSRLLNNLVHHRIFFSEVFVDQFSHVSFRFRIMTDPIDDMVIEDTTTQSVADRLAEGMKSLFSRLSNLLGRTTPGPKTTEEGSEISTHEGVSVPTPNGSSSSSEAGVKSVPHVSHPYCFSEPRNPFVEDIGKDWSFPSERTTKHILDQDMK